MDAGRATLLCFRCPMLLSLLLLLACTAAPDSAAPKTTWSYPLDDVLTFADLQAVGTHNSYHVETEGNTVPDWDYTMQPLDVQLGELGVRQFELDLYYDDGSFLVQHIPLLDQGTTCATFAECLSTMRAWSDRNPAHHPLFTLLEPKSVYDDDDTMLDAMDAEILSAWPRERLITPDDLQGAASSLKEAVEGAGWPTLGELRGRALFVLHDGGDWRDAYTAGGTTAAGRVCFPDAMAEVDLPIAAVHTMNDPVADAEAIAAAVAANHLVRTRAEADVQQPVDNDTSTRDAALASGAQFVSSDWPEPRADSGYVVQIPGGTPSRCNPLRSVPDCTSEAIEDPAFIVP